MSTCVVALSSIVVGAAFIAQADCEKDTGLAALTMAVAAVGCFILVRNNTDTSSKILSAALVGTVLLYFGDLLPKSIYLIIGAALAIIGTAIIVAGVNAALKQQAQNEKAEMLATLHNLTDPSIVYSKQQLLLMS